MELKRALVLAAACAAAWAHGADAAAAKVGVNMLNNSALAFGRDGGPLEWNPSYEKVKPGARFEVENGTNVVTMIPYAKECTVRQPDLVLVPGAKYRVGAWVRTKNFSASMCGVVIYNWAWTKADGPAPFPRDTNGEWVRFEKVVEAPKSTDGRHTFAFYCVGVSSGEVAVCNPWLEPVDEAAAAGAKRAPRRADWRIVTPVAPLLAEIPEGDSEILFSYMGETRTGRCAVATKMAGESGFRAQGEFALRDDAIRAAVKGLAPGRGRIRATLRDDAGKVVAESEYPIRVVAKRAPLAPGKRLNNLVTQLHEGVAADGEIRFDTPRDGWIWIALSAGAATTRVTFDGGAEPVIVHRAGERFETMRRVKAGRHRISLAGTAGGRVRVNAVPELSAYTYPAKLKYLDCYGAYRGKFLRERLFPAINIFSYGYDLNSISEAEHAEMRALGKELYAQGCRPGGRCEEPSAFAAATAAYEAKADARVSGRTFDEIPIDSAQDKRTWAETMRLLAEARLPMATWSSGYTFSRNALNAEYLSAVVNQADGRGRFQFECYPYMKADETAANADFDDMLNDSMRRAKALVPDAVRSSWVVMGTYTKLDHSLCYDDADNADYKRHVDLYLHRLATDPEFDGLAGFGVYSYHNAEEEDLRWILDLVRHYCLRGRTEKPSEKLGFAYNPDVLKNGSFANGLDGWKADAAAEPRKVKGLGKLFHYRDSANGDCACVLKRAKGEAALERRLVNLVPGKVYSLRCAVASVADMAAKDAKARRLPVEVKIDGVDDVTASSPLAEIDGAEREQPKFNVRFVVFRAKTSEATLRIALAPAASDAEAGEEYAVTAVRVKPYYW